MTGRCIFASGGFGLCSYSSHCDSGPWKRQWSAVKCSKVHCIVISVQYSTEQSSKVQCSAFCALPANLELLYLQWSAIYIWHPANQRARAYKSANVCSVVYSSEVLCILLQCCVVICSVVYYSAVLCIIVQCCVFSCSVVYSCAVLCIIVHCCVFFYSALYSCAVFCIDVQCSVFLYSVVFSCAALCVLFQWCVFLCSVICSCAGR